MTKTANNPTPPLSQWRQVRNQAIRLIADRLGNSPTRVAALRICDLFQDGKVLCWLKVSGEIFPIGYETREALRRMRPQGDLFPSYVSAAFGRRPDSYRPLSPRQIARIIKSASSADKKTESVESVKSVVKNDFNSGLNGQ